MPQSLHEISPNLNGKDLSIGLVMSRFNHEIGEGLLSACMEELVKLGIQVKDIELISVPGALEIPFALQQMAASDEYNALIALGAVIRGDTYHFEIVATQSATAIMQLQLEYELPIVNAILTTNDDEQALTRMTKKGTEAARVAIEMANLARQAV